MAAVDSTDRAIAFFMPLLHVAFTFMQSDPVLSPASGTLSPGTRSYGRAIRLQACHAASAGIGAKAFRLLQTIEICEDLW